MLRMYLAPFLAQKSPTFTKRQSGLWFEPCWRYKPNLVLPNVDLGEIYQCTKFG